MTVDKRDFEISSKREILAILHSMRHQNPLLNISIPGTSDAALTSLLSVEDELSSIVLDAVKNKELNQKLLGSQRVKIEGALNSIKIEFHCTSMSDCQLDGRSALMAPVPLQLTRLQRREFFRVATPIVNPVLCRVPCPTTGQIEIVTLTIKNVSAGGALLVDEKMKLSAVIGTIYKKCEIIVPGFDPIVTDMQVKNTLAFMMQNGTAANKVGLKFLSMEPRSTSNLQRYINKLELEHRAIKTS